MLLLGLNLLDQFGDLALRGDIGGDWDNLSFNALTVVLDDVLELFLGAANDVDLSSIDSPGDGLALGLVIWGGNPTKLE